MDDDDFGSGGLGQGPFAASSQTTQRERKQPRHETLSQLPGGYRNPPPDQSPGMDIDRPQQEDVLQEIKTRIRNMEMPNVYNIHHSYNIQQTPPPDPPQQSIAEVRNQLMIEAEKEYHKQNIAKKEKVAPISVINTYNVNPIKEIIHKFHEQSNPTQLVQPININYQQHNPVIRDDAKMMEILEHAVKRNYNLEALSTKMGLTLEQIAQLLDQKNKPAISDDPTYHEEQPSASSSTPSYGPVKHKQQHRDDILKIDPKPKKKTEPIKIQPPEEKVQIKKEEPI